MDIFLPLFGALIGASVVIAIGSRLWFEFRWQAFGWRPKILDESKVTKTVEECSVEALRNDARDAEEIHGHVMSEDEMNEHLQQIRRAFRMVIERYVKNFSQKL